jgi:hypothetical protein
MNTFGIALASLWRAVCAPLASLWHACATFALSIAPPFLLLAALAQAA